MGVRFQHRSPPRSGQASTWRSSERSSSTKLPASTSPPAVGDQSRRKNKTLERRRLYPAPPPLTHSPIHSLGSPSVSPSFTLSPPHLLHHLSFPVLPYLPHLLSILPPPPLLTQLDHFPQPDLHSLYPPSPTPRFLLFLPTLPCLRYPLTATTFQHIFVSLLFPVFTILPPRLSISTYFRYAPPDLSFSHRNILTYQQFPLYLFPELSWAYLRAHGRDRLGGPVPRWRQS